MMAAAGSPPLETMPVDVAREMANGLFASMAGELAPVAKVEDRTAPGPAGDIPLRVYTPAGQGPFPILLYFHGGGWTIGNRDAYDGPCRALARAVPCVVASVEYRLAPEHKFPAAAEDCYAVTRWMGEHGATLGGDPGRVAIGGDSAGGNLTAVVALMARDRGGPRLAHQVMIYPATDAALQTASYRDNADGYFLTTSTMRWFWGNYLTGPADVENPYVSPLRATDHRGLPSATILTAEFDPLRDDGESYAQALRAADVPVRLKRFDGQIHAFLSLAGTFPQAAVAIEDIAADLRSAFVRR